MRRFDIDLGEAAEPDPNAYRCFNEFFTRALRPGARPLPADARALACPVDGVVSQIGRADGRTLVQAKGRRYDLTALLAGDPGLAARFAGGAFATLYLSPRDYHRVHMPVRGRLRRSERIAGRLFAVNPAATAVIPALFTRNERLLGVFDTAAGPMAVILVGALFVGCIETVWDRLAGDRTALELGRGEELGRFNMGSTVIVLFAPERVHWRQDLRPGTRVRVGEVLGRWTGGPDAAETG